MDSMEIKVGEYVRTKNGKIGKFKKYLKSLYFKGKDIELENYIIYLEDEDEVVRHSKNIIDLIEVGDYVNGQQITKVTYDPFVDNQTDLWTDRTIPFGQDFQKERFLNEDIKTILTHEQFKQNCYRLEEK